MHSRPTTTLRLAQCAFVDKGHPDADKATSIPPNRITRFAFDPKSGFRFVEVSDEHGPRSDGQLEVIDAIVIDKRDIGGYDAALLVRLESIPGLDSFVAQAIGEATCAYMERSGCREFATAAIGDLDTGYDLHRKWNSLLLLCAKDGSWRFKNLLDMSVQLSTDDTYAILRDCQVGTIQAENLVSTLLIDEDRQAALHAGFELEEGTHHLVRAPIHQGGAFAVVGGGLHTVYDAEFNVIGASETGMTIMPTINEDGTPIQGKVTTVSGKGEDWHVQRGVPTSTIPENLASAYGSATA